MTSTEPSGVKRVQVLSESELDAVHETTLRILSEVGVRFDHAEAISIFRKCSGVEVDGSTVRIKPKQVEQTIQSAPSKITLHARNVKYSLQLGEGHTYFTSAFGATFLCDSEHRLYRDATLDDVRDYLILADAMPNVNYVLMPFIPQDLPPEFAELFAIALQFNFTEKHLGLSSPGYEHLDEIIAMGRRIASDLGVEGPLFSFGCTISSPLTLSRDIVPKLITSARAGIPLRIVSGALVGATAPVTLAGALAMQNAEVLAGMTLCQIVNPGTPVEYGTFTGAMDMRTGKWAGAGPEMALINGATAQLCKRYGIPLGYGTGGVGESRTPDVRAGFEKAMTMLFGVLAGVEVVHNGVSGLLADGMAVSFEQLIIDNEMAGIARRLLRGITVDEGTLALEVTRAVGPGGQFLEQEHTLKWFRQEHHLSPLLNRAYPLEWPASEQETMLVQARDQVKHLLANHRPAPLPPETQAHIQSVVEQISGIHRKLF
jgi:trimethylamine---corrinoid protein Co-methyltransferase